MRNVSEERPERSRARRFGAAQRTLDRSGPFCDGLRRGKGASEIESSWSTSTSETVAGACGHHSSIRDSWPIALFGYPRGHRVNGETECLSTVDAYRKRGYSPSNRALRETRLASSRNNPKVGIGSRYALKRLVVSVLPDRSVLLSSRSLMQWPQSCAPESGAPSGAPSRGPANSDRTVSTDRPWYRPAWPRS